MKHILLFLLVLNFKCFGDSINPLIGHWKTDVNKTFASAKVGSKARECFKQKLCGSTDFIFSRNELTSITYSQCGEVLMKHSEPYEVKSYKGNEITIYFPKQEKTFTYKIETDMIYYSSEEHGFTEYFVLQKSP